ncbi:MAG: ABC-2 family transporter protein, partial [Spirochaetota bacterium]
RLRARFRCYSIAGSTAIRERLAYAGNFHGAMLTYGLFVFIFSRVWAGAYATKSTIAGYTMAMAVWYFIVAEVPSFGMGRFFVSLSQDMKSGQVAYQLSRPYDFIYYHYAERFGGSLADAVVIMSEGLVLGVLLLGGVPAIDPSQGSGPAVEAGRAALLVLSLLMAGTLGFFLQFSLAMTAFWLEENEAFFWIYQKLMLIIGTLIPIEFLPEPVATIAAWTPFPYLSYAPARMFVAFSWAEAGSLIVRQSIWLLVAVVLAKAVFALGSRRIAMNGG